jgi:hypothetical protein
LNRQKSEPDTVHSPSYWLIAPQISRHIYVIDFTHTPGIGLAPMVPDIAHDPLAIGLFGAIGIVVIHIESSLEIRNI